MTSRGPQPAPAALGHQGDCSLSLIGGRVQGAMRRMDFTEVDTIGAHEVIAGEQGTASSCNRPRL